MSDPGADAFGCNPDSRWPHDAPTTGHVPLRRLFVLGSNCMSAIQKLFEPLRLAAAAFFRHDLALRRDAAGLQVVLEPKAVVAKKKKPSRSDAAVRQDKQELALIVDQLGGLLAEIPESRSALLHLVFVEQALKKKGLRALHKLPLVVLERALEQLEGLVVNWSPVGLASLRSKMAVAIIDREHMDPEVENDAYQTAAVLDTMPVEPAAPAQPALSDDDALAAAYAALGDMAPSGEIAFQGELGSPSARAVALPLPRASASAGDIRLREVQT